MGWGGAGRGVGGSGGGGCWWAGDIHAALAFSRDARTEQDKVEGGGLLPLEDHDHDDCLHCQPSLQEKGGQRLGGGKYGVEAEERLLFE